MKGALGKKELLTVARRFSLQVKDLTIPLVDNGARLFELSYQRGLFGNVHAAPSLSAIASAHTTPKSIDNRPKKAV
jgi:hypothetical protein